VGAGTQDILLYREDIPIEGSTKMVLPSQTVIVGGRIEQARAKKGYLPIRAYHGRRSLYRGYQMAFGSGPEGLCHAFGCSHHKR
jgi:hypothetical protein